MADFRIRREIGTFDGTALHYTVRVEDDTHVGGDVVLSLVTNAGAHGTHVASIAAAHHEGDGDGDGPGGDGQGGKEPLQE